MNTLKLSIGIMAFLFATVCHSGNYQELTRHPEYFEEEPVYVVESRELNKREKESVSSAIRERLIDPESARFTWPKVIITNKDLMGVGKKVYVYCGLVNSENSLGRYAGNSIFSLAIANDGKGHYEVTVAGIDSKYIGFRISCANYGYEFY